MEFNWKSLNYLNYVIGILLVLNSCRLVPGKRRCYSCSTLLESDDKYDCLYNVDNVTDRFMEYCPYPYYCTIRRQDFADVHAGISYLNRSCEEGKLNEVQMGGTYITYIRSCRRHLCNTGDGIDSLKDIPEDTDEDLDSEADSSVSATIRHFPVGGSILRIIFVAFHLII